MMSKALGEGVLNRITELTTAGIHLMDVARTVAKRDNIPNLSQWRKFRAALWPPAKDDLRLLGAQLGTGPGSLPKAHTPWLS